MTKCAIAILERFAQDEFLPYWAEFWPACRLLAELVDGWPTVPDGAAPPTVLEIGCGLGLASLVARSRGYSVIASDYDDDALAFVEASSERNAIPTPVLRWLDWREHYQDLQPQRIIAAEVLYERRNLPAIARFLRYHLAPGGVAWIVDGNRQTADAFPDACTAEGLRVAAHRLRGAASDCSDVNGRVFEVRPTA